MQFFVTNEYLQLHDIGFYSPSRGGHYGSIKRYVRKNPQDQLRRPFVRRDSHERGHVSLFVSLKHGSAQPLGFVIDILAFNAAFSFPVDASIQWLATTITGGSDGSTPSDISGMWTSLSSDMSGQLRQSIALMASNPYKSFLVEDMNTIASILKFWSLPFVSQIIMMVLENFMIMETG